MGYGDWYGIIRYGIRYGVMWHSMVRYGIWCGMVWYGMAWHGMAWYGVVWCGVVRCGVVWCGMVWYGVMMLFVVVFPGTSVHTKARLRTTHTAWRAPRSKWMCWLARGRFHAQISCMTAARGEVNAANTAVRTFPRPLEPPLISILSLSRSHLAFRCSGPCCLEPDQPNAESKRPC